MSELSPTEKAFLDTAYERLKTTRRTFTEREALAKAKREGYALRLSFDERFAKAEGRQGEIPPHWRLAEQTLANTRLLNELQTGTWDGRNLDAKLLKIGQEDQLNYTFYPHDPRLFQNRQGTWEVTGERQITLPPGLKEELDSFKERLHVRWTTLGTPLTRGQVLSILEDLGWQHDGLTSVDRYVRAWLLTCEQFRRVGPDYWLPVELLPPLVQRTRLQTLPIRTSPVLVEQHEGEYVTAPANEEQGRTQSEESLIFKGTAIQSQAVWTKTLQSIHLIEGFIPIPEAMRGVYPPLAPGIEQISVLKGLWYEDDTDLWIWLDRTHHRLYGPDLLNAIGLLSAGIKLRIEWHPERIILRIVGHDQEVQREETRLLDLEELKHLRGGIGEGYRQAIQSLLLATPQGLTFKEIVLAIRQRQNHEVPRRTIRATLSNGGFIQREQRWFAAPDTKVGARRLKEALLETLVEHEDECEHMVMSQQEYVRTRVRSIHRRLKEIKGILGEVREK